MNMHDFSHVILNFKGRNQLRNHSTISVTQHTEYKLKYEQNTTHLYYSPPAPNKSACKIKHDFQLLYGFLFKIQTTFTISTRFLKS